MSLEILSIHRDMIKSEAYQVEVDREACVDPTIYSQSIFWRKTRYFVRLVKSCHFLVVGKKRNGCLICGGSVGRLSPPPALPDGEQNVPRSHISVEMPGQGC